MKNTNIKLIYQSKVIKALFKLDMEINENTLFAALKDLGQNGASKVQGLLLLKKQIGSRKAG
jgi:hypothetical protein